MNAVHKKSLSVSNNNRTDTDPSSKRNNIVPQSDKKKTSFHRHQKSTIPESAIKKSESPAKEIKDQKAEDIPQRRCLQNRAVPSPPKGLESVHTVGLKESQHKITDKGKGFHYQRKSEIPNGKKQVVGHLKMRDPSPNILQEGFVRKDSGKVAAKTGDKAKITCPQADLKNPISLSGLNKQTITLGSNKETSQINNSIAQNKKTIPEVNSSQAIEKLKGVHRRTASDSAFLGGRDKKEGIPHPAPAKKSDAPNAYAKKIIAESKGKQILSKRSVSSSSKDTETKKVICSPPCQSSKETPKSSQKKVSTKTHERSISTQIKINTYLKDNDNNSKVIITQDTRIEPSQGSKTIWMLIL